MNEAAGESTTWRLEASADSGERVVVRPLPFLVGRRENCDFYLDVASVSSRHAEIFERNGELWIRDLGSTNGTFLNGNQVIAEERLREGDLVHFADQQFRLMAERRIGKENPSTKRLSSSHPSLAPRAVRETVGFLEMLREEAMTAVYQAVYRLQDGALVGYEALGRGAHPKAPTRPDELFRIGKSLGMAAELSRALRRRVLAECSRLPLAADGRPPVLFLNTDPAEMTDSDDLLRSLGALNERQPELPVIVELHEDSATRLDVFQRFRAQLREIGVGQAFDDFGKGEERLQELCELAPDYVKFDRQFARGLDRATSSRREMVGSLVAMLKRMGVTTVIEGVETAEELAACRALGFELAQGYHYGQPAPLALLTANLATGDRSQ